MLLFLNLIKIGTRSNRLLIYFGGSGNDGTNLGAFTAFNYGDRSRSDVAIDNTGNIYITSTLQILLICQTAVEKLNQLYGGGESDGFVAKFNAEIYLLLSWATYYGGSADDVVIQVCRSIKQCYFICGHFQVPIFKYRNGLNPNYRGCFRWLWLKLITPEQLFLRLLT